MLVCRKWDVSIASAVCGRSFFERRLTMGIILQGSRLCVQTGCLCDKANKIILQKEEKYMNDTIEIRWHGRGGQGAKTAALLLADVAFKTGKYVQGFPEYGPERMGAPITAYNRVSESPITIHSNIYDPDFVAVVDDSLLEAIDVTHGLKTQGAIVVNTQRSKEEIVAKLHGYEGKVVTLDARKISVEALGRYYPNSPMLAAMVAVSGVMEKETFLKEMKASFEHKFAKKPEVIEGNMKALELTFAAIEGEI